MKKNKALTAAISVLSLTMVSLCAIGGTFAKYASQGSATDTAHVAKWGVELRVTGNDAFAEKYDVNALAGSETVVSVNAATNGDEEDNVLAPGTNGTLGSIVVNGTPEVRVSITRDLEIVFGGWELEGAFYCPIIISDGTNSVNGLKYNSAAEFEAAIELLVDQVAIEVDANTSLAYSKTLTWSWPFYTSDANDVKDSLLGDAGTATITATWNASVTQVD